MMPRTYQKRLGARGYKNYTEELLDRAITAVTEGRMTLRAASEKFNIPYGTIFNKYHGKYIKKPGAQPVFSKTEEETILKSCAKCADWGYPLTTLDLRMFAKILLDSQGRTVSKFRNNMPGQDWAYSLLNRHKNQYSQRVSTNIKRARAAVSRESIEEYFKNLENTLKEVPDSNIFNYDESNLSDDPGKKIGIFRRGVKYPEKAMNFSKSATSIMVCGSADGVLLPPYIIYKSLHLYDTWKERAPRGPPCCNQPCCSGGSRFNRTVSGWFDAPSFRDWFVSCFMPHAKRLPGRKVLIGDNLSSHLDEQVIKLCSENDIDFVCLVPHSTHLCQPLDVAFFRPMKTAWRQVLTNWKMQNAKLSSVPKDTFPHLLTNALNKMDEVQPKPNSEYKDITSGIKRNMMSGFRAAGIYPFNKQKVLDRLPKEDIGGQEIESALTNFLKESRYGSSSNQSTRKKRRLDVAPGKSIATREETIQSTDPEQNEIAASDIQETEIQALVGPSTSQGEAPRLDDEEIPDRQIYESDPDEDVVEAEDEKTECSLGRFVLAKFYTRRGKKTYKYVCQIVETEPLLVEGFKSVGTKRKFKRVPDDISEIDYTDIISYLPKPVKKDDFIIFPFDINIQEL
ncbi:uncharacterized protein LOC132904125 [Amyelois transitella]|uniref:uncharacterized protein LOC132904125 n=1 Tax=Amyelois transitella TaxID=680683 RepID=UPI00298F9E27|nr:uncharacterized protein LOC132904125 [Amyelois transitella]